MDFQDKIPRTFQHAGKVLHSFAFALDITILPNFNGPINLMFLKETFAFSIQNYLRSEEGRIIKNIICVGKEYLNSLFQRRQIARKTRPSFLGEINQNDRWSVILLSRDFLT